MAKAQVEASEETRRVHREYGATPNVLVGVPSQAYMNGAFVFALVASLTMKGCWSGSIRKPNYGSKLSMCPLEHKTSSSFISLFSHYSLSLPAILEIQKQAADGYVWWNVEEINIDTRNKR